jgi:CspA family cold shock protein
MLTGKIRSLNADKGFGFITPSTGGVDVFFHCSAVDAEFTELKLEQAVQYEHDSSAAKPRAKQVLSGTKNPRTKNPPTKRSTLGGRPGKKSAATTNRSGIHGGSRNNNRLGRGPGSKRSSSYPRTPRPEIDYVFGYITKLPRKNPIGFISSVDGGPEYYFEPKDVRGNKKFWMLAVGDYVRFVAHPNAENPKQPLAKMVEVVPKLLNRQENHLPRHPKARGKKPTWKS